ncbi:MAG: HlyB/MsbA family transporter [Clostridia bacterium]|nr:HlyB/MsbA family transporter [Clostridia bacterium]
MPPGVPPSGVNINEIKPKNFGEWIKFIFKNFKDTMHRLIYIYKLVWEARPWILLLLSFMAVFNGISPIAGAYIHKLLLDKLTMAAFGELEGTFWQLGGLLVLQLAYQFFIHLINSINNIVNRISNEVLVNSIRLKIMNKARTIDLACFDLPEFFSKLENANREVGGRPLQILQSSFSVISSVISMVSFIILLSSIITWAPIVIILTALPSALIHYKYRSKMFNYVRRRSKDRRQMDYYGGLLTNKDLVKEVKLFNLADTFIEKYKNVFLNYYNGVKKLIVNEGIWGIVLSVINTTANGLILVLIAMKVFDRMLTVGDYSLYSGALFSIAGSVSNLVNTTAGIYEGTLFIDNMITFMNQETYIIPSLPEPREVTRHMGHVIEFKNVSFSYPGTEKKVLKNINITINPGETVVLVGLNGAGKTTLLKILTRLYDPTEGVVLFDGHDIKEYKPDELYKVFGIIFQDFGKYAFSVSENISFGQIERKADEEGIHKAAIQSDAEDFISKLKVGYNTPLTRVFEEEGTELSIGQWQKIAVARAFFRDSDIMILDEPTASLDPMAEQEIFNQFDELRGNKSTIFVSHRLSSATIANKIIVLENGEVVEIGNHRELLNLNGKYAELFNTQAKRYIDNTISSLPDDSPTDNRRPSRQNKKFDNIPIDNTIN